MEDVAFREGVAQGAALFLGGFLLANLLGEAVRPGFDQTIFLLEPGRLPGRLSVLVRAVAGILLVWFALSPLVGPLRQRATVVVVAVLLFWTLADSAAVFRAFAGGGVKPALPVPLSALLALGLLLLLRAVLQARPAHPAVILSVAGLLAFALPVAQIAFLGLTDYRRAADAAVVFGARAYSDGSASDALADRVRTAAGLFREGIVPIVVFSGGPGDGEVHETEAMRRLARRLGVPEEAIRLDPEGWNTNRTVANSCRLLDREGCRRILAVSHDFHLPRIRMAYRRAGREVLTVPARQARPLSQKPYCVLREVAAFWVYWIRPVS